MSHDLNSLDAVRACLVASLPQELLCIDVGARWGADKALLALKGQSRIICFDPDPLECERLQSEHPIERVEYVPLALSSDGRDLQLHVTRQPACSSIYPPISALYGGYPVLIDIEPQRVETVRSTRLADYLVQRGLGLPDLLKLDTQGSELDILRGAAGAFESACMIDIEVEFNPIYEGQALFCDVDRYLRDRGFALWRLPFLAHYTPEHFAAASTPILTNSAPPGGAASGNPGNGQLFWAQAHYVRREILRTDAAQLSCAEAAKAALVAAAYGYWDLALMALEKCGGTSRVADALKRILRQD